MQRRTVQEDEVLERLWHLREEGRQDLGALVEALGEGFDPAVLPSLAQQGLVILTEGGQRVELTARGEPRAERVIRAHRLGERLIYDAFGGDFEAGACELEHAVTGELVDAICTLLGHPRDCPHGLPIPEGDCCRRAETTVASPAVALTALEVGQEGRVAYVRCRDDGLLHRIDGLHIRPGATVRVHQKYPTFVIECEGAAVALGEDVAASICVWRASPPAGAPAPEPAPAPRRGWFGRRTRG